MTALEKALEIARAKAEKKPFNSDYWCLRSEFSQEQTDALLANGWKQSLLLIWMIPPIDWTPTK